MVRRQKARARGDPPNFGEKTMKQHNGSIDIYSAGVTLLECAVGLESNISTAKRIALKEMLEKWPDAAILSKMLKKPSLRPSCDEILADPWVFLGGGG